MVDMNLKLILQKLYIVKYSNNYKNAKPVRWNPLLIIITLVLAVVSGLIEFCRGFIMVFKEIYSND